jgi:hypothetical protein
MPKRLIWMRDSPATKVKVDGIETVFDSDGRTVSVPLTTFSKRTQVEVE